MPRQFVVRYESGDSLIANRDGQRHTSNALSELGGLQRRLARGFLGGEVVTVIANGSRNTGGALHLTLTAVK
jgi:putative exporter of polyketide antibiotics